MPLFTKIHCSIEGGPMKIHCPIEAVFPLLYSPTKIHYSIETVFALRSFYQRGTAGAERLRSYREEKFTFKLGPGPKG